MWLKMHRPKFNLILCTFSFRVYYIYSRRNSKWKRRKYQTVQIIIMNIYEIIIQNKSAKCVIGLLTIEQIEKNNNKVNAIFWNEE